MLKDESAKDRVIRLLREHGGGEDQAQTTGPTFHGDRNVNISGSTVVIVRCPIADNGCSYRQIVRAIQYMSSVQLPQSEASNDD